ncbi:acetate CoA-transferase YdiF [Salmonella enterica subsp. enterica]|nr:acetate CoA-transferase YdiF [Salmonella enterica subsp. enterica serovar Hvittingfoss]EDP8741399.1 acyl CoA:acetate/3-ketoacid CoA transferase [Salmonella enterica subsp. enterica serovar Hvittingfoss]EEF2854177.1 acetate CoA-transferase YdiF [Salmonella enterica subsp. enterica serovar Enteritidis]EHN5408924.1 acyl CoA:acetate/3-ketoacid CoA transferase [Salmonella enterica subsp. enterica serovar Enteritidis]
MKINKPSRINGRVPVLSAQEAVNYIPDEATLCILGAGGGILEATTLITALADKYQTTQSPRDLSIISPTGLGDRADRGISPLAQEGLVKWALCGHWGQSPRISELAEQNKIAAYNYPQGVLTQTLRASAAHQPGILSDIGIGTFVDPRQQGGKLNDVTKEDLIKLVEIDNKEYLYYKAIAPNVAFIRATTCDSEGYASFEDEVMYLDALVIAQAVHNNGGIVMMQMQKMVKKATLHPKSVRIPGYLVDIVVVDADQTQLYGGAPVNRFISGDFTLDDSTQLTLPLNQRKLVARRALFEMRKGAVGNVGVGIADGIGLVAREEGCADDFVLTVETGPVGGITSQGVAFGANVNTRAILDMTSQFDFYHGGGLDVCYLSFAEVDQHGNVGVHKFNGKIMGTGGFIDISATSQKIIFCGTLTAGSLKTEITDGKLNILQEGRVKKFVSELPEITFSGKIALERGLDVRYITERAVFTLKQDGLHLIEIAPGVDLQRDILDKMDFSPVISPDLKLMDTRLFTDSTMGFTLPDATH